MLVSSDYEQLMFYHGYTVQNFMHIYTTMQRRYTYSTIAFTWAHQRLPFQIVRWARMSSCAQSQIVLSAREESYLFGGFFYPNVLKTANMALCLSFLGFQTKNLPARQFYRTSRLTSHSDPLCFSLDDTIYLPLGAGREELVQPVQVASSATGAPVRGPHSLAAYIVFNRVAFAMLLNNLVTHCTVEPELRTFQCPVAKSQSLTGGYSRLWHRVVVPASQTTCLAGTTTRCQSQLYPPVRVQGLFGYCSR